MYPTQMRRHRITRTLLIFFIVCQVVNFVFGAPVAAVREKLEGPIDADGTVPAALQKRVKPVPEWSTNKAGQTPSIPDRTEMDQLWQEMRIQGMFIDSPTPQYIPGRSSPTFSGSSTGSADSPMHPPLPVSPPPLTPSPPPPLPVSPPPRTPPPPPMSPLPLTSSTPAPPLIEEHLPPAWPLADKPSTTGHQPTPQQNSGPDLDVKLPPNPKPHPPAAEIPVDEFLDMLMKGLIKRTFPTPIL
jgi:hypothetical protein